ncbi:MAG: HlyD family efflux transporter periplasmic adaptor subunit [Pyrinomonadaceae bacterium]|nr:HlyD family efflux transporter periplasmic adaptor subunit [Pyrinomonadaceae bacterium]
MSSPSGAPPTDGQESIDLAELGKSYTPAQTMDTTPEVSDVIAKMPWWAARGLIYIIAGFVVVAFVWASLSMVDLVTESRGTLVPEGYVKPVQSAGAGVVQAVFVKEGETIESGQALVQLDATEIRTRLGKLREEFSTNQTQLRQLMVDRPVGETLEQRNRIARLQTEIAAAELSLRHTTITAPVGGVITALDVRSTGAVLQSGQTIASIAPSGVRLVVEAQVPNKDIAFIEKGLPAKLKFDAFPFQEYGTVEGTVIEVSPDAQLDKELGSFYKVTIAPRQTQIAAKGKILPLRPGLALAAEIITERKSILSLILAPFRDLKGEITGAK